MALASPAGLNEFHLKGLLIFYVTFRPYLVKMYRRFSFPWQKTNYFVFTSYNRNAQCQREKIASDQRHVGT